MVKQKKSKKVSKPQSERMNITLSAAVGDPPATILGGNKWVTRWILVSKASGASLTIGDIGGALNTTSTKDSIRILRIQAFSPMDSIGQSLTFNVSQAALMPAGNTGIIPLPDLTIVDYGTGTSRASAQAMIPRNSQLYPIDSSLINPICSASASGATPGNIVYRLKIAQTV
jgi:hypothetical protein